ncbi:MAG: phospholipase, partial [Flavobacterium sp.]|nr:phospholipase [Flavobacterium sp.]
MQKLTFFILIVLFPFGILAQESKGTFATEIRKQVTYRYMLYKPQLLQTKKPLIVFLHGSGEKGTDLEKVKSHGPLKYVQNNKMDAFILAPQCPEDEYWESESLHQ